MGTLLSQDDVLHTCQVHFGMEPQFLNKTPLTILSVSNKGQELNIILPTTSPSESI